jgi:hypothetical protein
MRRTTVLGALIGVGALSIAVAGFQAPAGQGRDGQAGADGRGRGDGRGPAGKK